MPQNTTSATTPCPTRRCWTRRHQVIVGVIENGGEKIEFDGIADEQALELFSRICQAEQEAWSRVGPEQGKTELIFSPAELQVARRASIHRPDEASEQE